MRARAGLAAVLAAAALAVPACGDDDQAAGPAALVPADASIYVEGLVRPEGDQAEAAEQALGTLSGQEDIGARTVAELDARLADEGAGITYGEDIEPWLGERAAFFVTAADAEEPDGALIFEQTDAEAAQEALDKLAASSPGEVDEASYEDVSYFSDGESGAGLVGDFVVIATEQGFRDVVDVEGGGDSLADEDEFSAELEQLSDDALATAWVDTAELVAAAQATGEITPRERTAAEALFGPVLDQPFAAVLGAEPDSVFLELSTGAPEQGSAGVIAGGSELLGTLPGDSWLAFGSAEVGESIQASLGRLRAGGYPRVDRIGELFEARTGVELDRVLGALGDAAAFARGSNVFDAGGGLVIETEDPGVTADVIGVAAEVLGDEPGLDVEPLDLDGGGEGFSFSIPDAPGAVNVVQRDDRVAVVYGDESTERAFEPETTLEEAESFGAAGEMLGEDYEVAGFVDFEPIRELAGLAQLAGGADAQTEAALAVLDRLGFLVVGGRAEGERNIARVVLGLE